jgi:hypothetical protein
MPERFSRVLVWHNDRITYVRASFHRSLFWYSAMTIFDRVSPAEPLQFSRRAFSASSRTSSWALACRLEPYQQLHPAPLTPSVMAVLSLDKRLVCQPLSSRAINKAVKPSERMVLNIAFVQAEGKFTNVAAKMFLARMMIDADQAALENRENTLYAICGHAVTGAFSFAMIDGIVIEKHAHGPGFRNSFTALAMMAATPRTLWPQTRPFS